MSYSILTLRYNPTEVDLQEIDVAPEYLEMEMTGTRTVESACTVARRGVEVGRRSGVEVGLVDVSCEGVEVGFSGVEIGFRSLTTG